MEKKLMTAKSFREAEIVKQFEKNGKPYGTIKIPCDRCVNGIFVIGVENGRLKPHPNCNGVCFKCGGLGYELKDVRLYTEKELEAMERANEAKRQKKEQEREAKIKAEFAENKRKWIEENGFDTEGKTYIYAGNDSYSIKEQLKEDNFIFNPVLKWHKATKEEKYADRLIEIHLDKLCDISAWGKGTYRPNAQKIVEEKIAAVQPKSTSEWIGKVGDKLKDIKVQLIRKYSFDGKYGTTTVYNFVTEEGNNLTWFSSTYQPYDIGEWMKIKYTTIKDHSEYKGVKSTIITRTKLIDLAPAQE